VSLDTHRIPMPELYKEECMNNDRRRIRDVFSRIDDKKERLKMNPKIKELQRKIDNAISQKKRMMTLSLLEELRVEQDKEEKLILTKLKQEKKI